MAGASFDAAKFDELIRDQGYNALWRQAIVCQCMEDGQPDIHCPLCLGSGYRYIAPKVIKVVSSSFTGNQEIKIQGLVEPGQTYVTPQRDVIMGYHDLIEFYEIECKHSQVLDIHNGCTQSTYRPIREVSYVMKDNIVYEEGVDFEIEEDRHHLIWITEDGKPKDTDNISILYTTTPEYMVLDMVHELRSTRSDRGSHDRYTVTMPKQYLVKRLDFVYGRTINERIEPEIKPIESVFNYD